MRYNTLYPSKGIQTEVKKIIVHPKFNLWPIGNDIAIFHVLTPFDLTLKNVNSICLPKQGDDPIGNTNAVVTGWGSHNGWGHHNEWPHDHLMAVEMPFVNKYYCIKQHEDFLKKDNITKDFKIDERDMCWS